MKEQETSNQHTDLRELEHNNDSAIEVSHTLEEGNATTSSNNIFNTFSTFQTLESGFALARIADFFVKKDERVLRCHGFNEIFIPSCEKFENIIEKDMKNFKLRKIKEDREKRMAEYEERRKNREAASINSDSDDDEWDKKRRKKEKQFDHKKQCSPSTSKNGLNKSTQKTSFIPVVHCCVCHQIVNKKKFGGRDTLFCSAECISKKAEEAKKCVKEGERIMLIDNKGAIMNHTQLNPSIEKLKQFLHDNPSYQPVLAHKQDDSNLRVHDPIYQKKVESMRVDVRKAIETSLLKRSKAVNMCFSSKRYKILGLDIERALFSIHQDVNVKYRKWFKSFITVLADEKNDFFRDVLREKVSVKKLVTLSADQMITATTSCSIPNASSNLIIAAADSTSTSEVQEENVNSLSSTHNKLVPTTSRHTMLKKTTTIDLQVKSVLDDINNKDTTHLHQSHLYDANCGICKEKSLVKKFAQLERLKTLEEDHKKAVEEKNNQLIFPNLDPSIQAAMLEGVVEETASNELEKNNQLNFQSLDPSIQSAMLKDGVTDASNEMEHQANILNNNVLLDVDINLGSCNEFDQERQLRDPLGLDTTSDLTQEFINNEQENLFDTGNDFDDNDAFCDSSIFPIFEQRHIGQSSNQVWNGKFVWNKFISFNCTLSAISNKGAFKAGSELPSTLHVMGRSKASGVWSYVGRLINSWSKHIILLLVEHPQDQFELYTRCFEKANSCNNKQIIILDLSGHERIKDGYVFTCGPGMPLPSIISPLDCTELPDWCRKRGCMILMLVRRMDREDKFLRKEQKDNCRPLTLQPCNIPTERLSESTDLSDPRLDKNLTRHSKCYRPHRLFSEVPHLFEDLNTQFSEDEEGLEEGELLE